MENHGLQLVVHATVSFTHEGLDRYVNFFTPALHKPEVVVILE
jgi:hypothetical protein